MKRILGIMNQLSKNKLILALQEGSIAMLPIVVVYSLLVLSMNVLTAIPYMEQYSGQIHYLHMGVYHYYSIFPIIFTVTISISLAKRYDLEPSLLVIISLCALLSISMHHQAAGTSLFETFQYKILPIPISIYTAFTLKYLNQKKWAVPLTSNRLGFGIKRPFNSVIPAAITLISIYVINLVLSVITLASGANRLTAGSMLYQSDGLWGYIVTQLSYKITWFLGMNPHRIFSYLTDNYKTALDENAEAFANNEIIPNIITTGFSDFSNIGGAGSLFCLVVAILLYSRSKHSRHVAKLSFLPSTFNITEIIHYGLPVVLNPYFLLPFIFVPLITSVLTYICMNFGLVSPVVKLVPWVTPPLIDVYLSTSGDIFAVILQIVNFIIGVKIYTYYLKLYEAETENIRVDSIAKNLNLSSSRSQKFDFSNQLTMVKELKSIYQINTVFDEIAEGELLLYYQPIINTVTNRVVRMESLLRLKMPNNEIKLPYFLTEIHAAGLSQDLDLWVLEKSTNQLQHWGNEMKNVMLTINVNPSSLMNDVFVQTLIENINSVKQRISIEILESEIIFEELKLTMNLKTIRDNGIKVYLDDFGSGYSCLSMLSKLNIDGVKIDQEFTRNLNTEVGKSLLKSTLEIVNVLDLQTILEGVENKFEYDFAKSIGIQCFQGFLISKPLHPDEIPQFIKGFTTNSL